MTTQHPLFGRNGSDGRITLRGVPPGFSAQGPIAFDLQSFERPALACPICETNVVEPIGLDCLHAGRRNAFVRIDARGVHQKPDDPAGGVGVQIVIEFSCEHGHRFDYGLEFHEGQTFVQAGACLGGRPCEGNLQAIWRA